jgi:hypothetical protein
VLNNTGRILNKHILKGISYRLFILTSLLTTLTCGFGGASILAVESAPGIDPFVVKMHAWTAMIVFVLTAIMAFYAYKGIRFKDREVKTDRILLVLASIFIILFAFTTLVANRIR